MESRLGVLEADTGGARRQHLDAEDRQRTAFVEKIQHADVQAFGQRTRVHRTVCISIDFAISLRVSRRPVFWSPATVRTVFARNIQRVLV